MLRIIYKRLIPLAGILIGLSISMNATAQQYWENDPGGLYNPPSAEFNPIYFGYGSRDNVVYNKIDLQDGRNMQMDETTLYDNTGQRIATAWESGIGRVDGQRDGGLIAGSIYKFIIDGEEKDMTYAWSVNSSLNGRQSGWIEVDALSPTNDIANILRETKADRLALFGDRPDHDNYRRYEIQETRLPSYMEEYYLDPGRDASYSAGKARYYYSRDGYLTLLMNIPETGSQRYGVAHDIASEGASFYRDMTVDRVSVNIYPPSSTNAESHSLDLVWGYTETSAGDRILSWVNERGLRAVDDPVPPTPVNTGDLGITFSANNYDGESNPNDDLLVRDMGSKVGFIKEGNWVRFNDFDFGSGASSIEFSASSGRSGGTIQVRTGSPTGTLIASVDIERTGSWSSFETFGANLNRNVAGDEDLFLVFTGDSGTWLFDIQSFEVN